jgi:3-hydroxy-9,10-secoandrosta-1,3,5(10)-triene-9,17-dione monooxygenase reductase component
VPATGRTRTGEVHRRGIRVSEHGLPVLAGATVRIECILESVTEAGDHWFVLGRVLGLEARSGDDPLLFFRGQYGAFAKIA